jgi:Zn-dependent protease with chaperone function
METQVTALLFGPGLPATGQRGELRAAADHVEVSWSDTGSPAAADVDAFAGASVTAAIGDLTFAEVGFGKPGLELRWAADVSQIAHSTAGKATNAGTGAHWLVHVLNPADAATLRARADWAALPSLKRLNQQQRKQHTKRVVGWSMLALLVLAPLLALLLFLSQAARIAESIAERIPVAQEVRLGRQAFESMRGNLKLVDAGPTHVAVADIGRKLTVGSRYTYEFHVVDDATLNAFALPGGIVVVHTGLIAATRRAEELAGVLAHEVQHVELRHGTSALVKDLSWRVLWTWFTGDWGGTLAGQAAAQLGSLKFSRDAESAADEAGFDALVRAGIDPSGMPDFFAIMAKQAGDAPAAFLSTHPLSTAREQALRQRLAELSAKPFTPLDHSAWPPAQGFAVRNVAR